MQKLSMEPDKETHHQIAVDSDALAIFRKIIRKN